MQSCSDLLRNSIMLGVLLLLSHGENRTTDLWCALGKQAVTTVGKNTNEASRSDQCSKRARASSSNSSLRASCCPDRHGLPVPVEWGTQQEPCSEVLPLTEARCSRAALPCRVEHRNDPGCLCAPGRVPQSSCRHPECFPAPRSSSTGILDIKQAAACRQAWFQSSMENKDNIALPTKSHNLFKTLFGSGCRCGVRFV